LRKQVRRWKPAKIREPLSALRCWMDKTAKSLEQREPDLDLVRNALGRAYEGAQTLRRAIDPTDSRTIHRTRLAFKHYRYLLESLHPGIITLSKKQLAAMDRYQTRMGLVQDWEVLRQETLRFARSHKSLKTILAPLNKELEQREKAAIDAYLRIANQLDRFWPRVLSQEFLSGKTT
jgi:CHAD domain-containing protein